MFSDSHECEPLTSKKDREKYWIGRLVQAKVPIKKSLFEAIPANMVGLVSNIEENEDGLAYLLVVRWADGSTSPCYQHSVFTYNTGERID